MVLTVVYQWASEVKLGGITTGKTVDFNGKTVVTPMVPIVLSVDNSSMPHNLTVDFHSYITRWRTSVLESHTITVRVEWFSSVFQW